MVPDDSNDPSFLEAMARLGVEPLDRGKGRKSRGRADRKPAGKTPAPASPPAREVAPPSGAPSSGGIERPSPREASEQPAAGASRPAKAVKPQEVVELERELGEARQALARAEEARRALESERERWDSQRARLTAKNQELRQELDQARKAARQRAALRDVLMARGLADEDEALAVLRDLLATRPHELLQAIELADAGPLARLLDQRVALVAHDLKVDMGPECVLVRVSPERCEIAGGSDIRAGFRRLVDACRRARVSQVTIVGGSPAYRRELKRLAGPHGRELKLNLVSGTKRREKKRAEADLRTSDLVVIWGSTELDHSVSAVYTRSASDKLLTVHYRGISRMLSVVADYLDKTG